MTAGGVGAFLIIFISVLDINSNPKIVPIPIIIYIENVVFFFCCEYKKEELIIYTDRDKIISPP